MSSPRWAPDPPIRLVVSSARAGLVVAASFVVPAAAAAVAAIAAPRFVWNYVGLAAALVIGAYAAAVNWNWPRLLDIADGEVRLSSHHRSWSIPVGPLTGLAVVTATRREFTKDREVEVVGDHVYLTFARRPADVLGPVPHLTLDPTRDPDPPATAAAVRALATTPALTVRITRFGEATRALLAQLAQRHPEVEVQRPELRSGRVRGGWSAAYQPSTHPVWALEDVERLHPDHDLRELRGVAVVTIGVVVWLGDVTLLLAALS